MKAASKKQILRSLVKAAADACGKRLSNNISSQGDIAYGFREGAEWLYQDIEKLISIAYEANNHARRLLNTHDTNNERERKKIDDRAKYLAEHYADNEDFKIVQS